MKIKLMLVLGMVIGTLGLAVERNVTTEDVVNATENIVHDEKLSMVDVITKIEEATKNENIENKLNNSSDVIVEKLSLSNLTLNDTNNIETSASMDDINSLKVNDKPRNIILVLAEGIGGENSWEKLKKSYSFAVEGFFQNCKMHNKSEEIRKMVVTDSENCDCHKQLKSNISDLIAYAHTIKGMNTATVSESNLTKSTALGMDYISYNHHHHHHHDNNYHHKFKLFGNIDIVADSSLTHKIHPQSSNHSRALHMDNQLASSKPIEIQSSTAPTTTTQTPIKHHAINNNRDRVWDFFNMITKIRLDFLKNIFDSMHESPIFNRNREINSQNQSLHFPIQHPKTLIELITSTLMDLQTISNENRFLMIIIAPHNELSDIYKIIASQPSMEDNLVIISGLDVINNRELIPYVVNGPGANYFNNLQTIHELLSTIKLILDHCHGVCKNNELLPSSTSLPVESFVPKIRVARSDDDETFVDDEKPTEKDVTESDSGQEDVDDTPDDDFDDKYKSSGISHYYKNNSLTLTFSIVSSIIATFILHT